MLILCAVCAGFLLDLLFGDPAWLPHPVVCMGRYIMWYEKTIRPRFPETPAGARRAGRLLVISLLLVTGALTGSVCCAAYRFHPYLFILAEAFWCAQALALRGLITESGRVHAALQAGDVTGARKAVARIVGRDTETLSAEGVAKAAVETVAENFSDGFAAPLLYMTLGGAPLALLYKAVNTMDSMVGYRNEAYLDFGRAAAKTDDVCNYVPARIAALFLAFSAALCGFDFLGALRIRKRDANKHASPNAGQTESVCAGALGIMLGGDARYFGESHQKATLGDETRSCEAADILRTNRMALAAGVLLFLCLAVIRFLLVRAAMMRL